MHNDLYNTGLINYYTSSSCCGQSEPVAESWCKPKECDECTGCPIILNTECIEYKPEGASLLINSNMPKGSWLDKILEKFDSMLTSSAPNFSYFNLPCIGGASSLQEFAEKTDAKICSLVIPAVNLVPVYNYIDAINAPNITSSCGNILATDNIKQILIKLAAVACSGSGGTSPSIATTDTNTISWVTGGVLNHSLQAAVKISAQANNAIVSNVDGLYVPVTTGGGAGVPQSLTFNAGTGALSITGGNTVNIPLNTDSQTLSFDTGTSVLSITGGNSVNLSSLAGGGGGTTYTFTNSSSVAYTVAGTNVSSNVKISAASGNGIVVNADGLFANTAQDTLTVTDTNTVNLVTTGPSGHNLTAEVIIDTTQPNILTSSVNGLRVAPITATQPSYQNCFATRIISGSDVLTAADNIVIFNGIVDGTLNIGSPFININNNTNVSTCSWVITVKNVSSSSTLVLSPAVVLYGGVTQTDLLPGESLQLVGIGGQWIKIN